MHCSKFSAPAAVRTPSIAQLLNPALEAKPAARPDSPRAPPRPPARSLPAPANRWNRRQPAGPHGAQCRAKNRALPLGLPRQILRLQPMANLGIAAQRSGAAAGHIGQHHVVTAVSSSSAVASASRHSTRRPDAASRSRRSRQPLRARFAGHDARLRIPLGKDQRLSAGRGAAIQNLLSPRGSQAPPPVAIPRPESAPGHREMPRVPVTSPAITCARSREQAAPETSSTPCCAQVPLRHRRLAQSQRTAAAGSAHDDRSRTAASSP